VVRSSNQKPVVVGAKSQHPVFGCEGPEGDDLQPAVAGVFLVLRLGGDVANVDVGGFGFAGVDPIERVELVAAGNELKGIADTGLFVLVREAGNLVPGSAHLVVVEFGDGGGRLGLHGLCADQQNRDQP